MNDGENIDNHFTLCYCLPLFHVTEKLYNPKMRYVVSEYKVDNKYDN